MNKFLGLAFLCAGFCGGISAQESLTTKYCADSKISKLKTAKTTVANLAEDEYDMQYVKFNISLTNLSTFISGDVTTKAKVVASSMPAYVFELHNELTVDSVFINGLKMTATTNGNLRTVAMPTALIQNSMFTAQVFYHGQPTPGAGFFTRGLNNQSSPTWGTQVTYTLSQPYMAMDWWPTKQSLTDKIDSADIWITVASNLKAGSNGVLQNVTPMPGSKMRYEWKTKYPIDHYLLSAAVAPYVDYSFFVKFPGSNDSMLFQNYVYSNPSTLPYWKSQIDSVGGMIQYFSQLFGRYPFWQEKYGHCMAPLGGGMEHQTMTTQGTFSTTLSAHELGHQWFGDHVTCGSWKDIWLNEGFASYLEYIYVDHFRGAPQAYNYMLDKHNSVLQKPDGSVYVDDTTDANRIFSSRLTYNKGGAIVHSLRFVFNNDSLFFQMLRTYQNQFGGKTATTPDLKMVAQQALGQNLDTFFDQWIYQQGYPIYDAQWNQVGNVVIVKLDQTTSHSSVNLFHTPIELRLSSLTGDTVVRVYNNAAPQIFYFTWDKTMTGMSIDPNNWLLNDVGSIVNDNSLLSTKELSKSNFKVFPNPAHDAWSVTGLNTNSSLQLTDMNGRLIWEGKANNTATVPANNLSRGVYLLKISNNFSATTLKLVKH